MVLDFLATTGNRTITRWDADWPLSPGWVMTIAGLMLLSVAVVQWYRRRSTWRLSPGKTCVLWSLRALAIVLICWMIGRWHEDRYETVLPDLVLLLDSSESMRLVASERERIRLTPGSGEPLSRWEAMRKWLTQDDAEALRRLGESYRLQVSMIASDHRRLAGELPVLAEAIGQREPLGQTSRIGDHLIAAAQGQRGRSTAAIIVMTDGQVTEGASLEKAAQEIAALRLPIYAFPIGSREPQPQVALTEVIADPSAMVGDVVEVAVRWSWTGESNSPLEIRLVDALTGERLDQVTVTRLSAEGTGVSNLRFMATESGLRRLKVEIDEVPGEWNLVDNRSEFTVEVRDDQFRVLLVQGGPSYEFRFLKHLLERATTRDGNQPLVELISVLQRGDPGYADQDRSAVRLPPIDNATLEQLDLVILSDCSPSALGTLFQEKIVDLVTRVGISLVVIAGTDHLPKELSGTPLDRLLPIDPRGVIVRPSSTAYRWQLAPLGRTVKSLSIDGDFDWWDQAPGIYGLAPVSRVRPAARVLAEVTSESEDDRFSPAIVSQFVGSGQVWLHLTDETFRFRGADREGDHYEQFWLQLLRGLAKSRATLADDEAAVEVDGDSFLFGDQVEYQIRLGASLAILASGSAQATVFGSEGQQRTVSAELDSAGRGRFRGTIDGLEPGEYRIVLTKPIGGGTPPSDVFRVIQQDRERTATEVDLEGLSQLTAQTEGEMFDLDIEIGELIAALPAGEAVEVKAMEPKVFWNHPLVALILFGLLAAEWIGRRVWGGA